MGTHVAKAFESGKTLRRAAPRLAPGQEGEASPDLAVAKLGEAATLARVWQARGGLANDIGATGG